MIENFPSKRYKTIVVDPPWKYGAWGTGSDKSALSTKYNETPLPLPYPSMTVDEIKLLPISQIADTNCELYLWVTQKYLPYAFQIIPAWGFQYCQTLTWCKKPMGLGQGGLYCPTTEFLLLCRKGKCPKKQRINSTWFEVKRTGKHSKKPDFFQDMIALVSDEPRIELFARRILPGWDVWGNEIPANDTLCTVERKAGDGEREGI